MDENEQFDKEVLEKLKPYLNRMFRCVVQGRAAALAAYSPHAAKLEKTSKAAFKCDFIYDELRKEFQEPDISFEQDAQQRLICFDKLMIRIRVKKMDRYGYPRNYETPHNFFFQNQLKFDGEGFSPFVHLNLGYCENKQTEELAYVVISCPNGEKNAWAVRLNNDDNLITISSLFDPRKVDSQIRTRIKDQFSPKRKDDKKGSS